MVRLVRGVPMILYGSLTSPFVRKARIVIDEKAIPCSFVRENPRVPGSHAQRLNPLGKVPVLELDDGGALYDSRVVIEYLDSLGTPSLIPAATGKRWDALRLQALADGLLESTIRVWLERLRPESERRADFVEWETRRLERVLAALEREPRTGPYFGPEFGLADIVLGVALEYVDLRAPLNWRTWCPALVAWLAPISARPSFQRTALASDP